MKALVNNRSKRLSKKIGVALSYLTSFRQKIVGTDVKPSKEVEISTMFCTLTGALNRIGLLKFFDQIVPTDLKKMSIIFIETDYMSDNESNFPKDESDKSLQSFYTEILNICGSRDLIARWDSKDFVLICPEVPVESAVNLANKMSKTINNKYWKKGPKISCNSGATQVNGEDLHYLINNIKKELYKAKKAA